MQIRYVAGDLLAGNETLIAHSCNMRGAYASGIAGQIRQCMPFAYDAYRLAFEDVNHPFQLGQVIWAFDIGGDRPSRIVANMLGQENYGRRRDYQYVSYAALAAALQTINEFVGRTQDGTIQLDGIGPIAEVGLPAIGTGLGNGRWPVIADIIERKSTCFQPVVYLFDGRMPG